MEIENEVLLATSDGFYYDGVPSQGSYTPSTSATEGYTVEPNTEEVFKQIGSVLVVSQIVIVTLAVICIIKGLLNSINNKKIEGTEEDLSGESLNSRNMRKKATVPYYIFSIILFVGYGIINVITNMFKEIFI